VRLRRASRVPLTALLAVSLAAPAGAASTASSPLRVQVGQAKDLTRIEFHWAGPVAVSSARDGQVLTVRFSRNAKADVSRLRVSPPKWVQKATVTETARGLEVKLQLAADADAKVGQGDGGTYINVFARKDPPEPEAPQLASVAIAAEPRPDPAPASGVIAVRAESSGSQLLVRFPWRLAPASAIFRRGDAIWVVFDAKARLDLRALQGHPEIRSARVVDGDGITAVRLATSDATLFNAFTEGPTWTLALGPGVQPRPRPIEMGRDGDATPPALAAAVAGATRIAWLTDPVVGDRLAVVTAMPPSKGLAARRDFVELAALPSANGLAIERAAEDLDITSDGDIVRIARPGGLKLSPTYARLEQTTARLGLPRPASMPALIDSDAWSQTGKGGFLVRYDQLLALASEESAREAADKTTGVDARMALARFLVGSELSFEAIGVLDMVGRRHAEMMSNAEFRGLRGAAKVMAGRHKEALTDFASPALAEDPSSALWAGYANAMLGHWSEAHVEFQKGLRAVGHVEPKWRARFARADAESGLVLGDLDTTRTQLAMALSVPQSAEDQLETRLVQARYFEARGAAAAALPIYDAIARAPLDGVATPATLRATQIRLDQGKVTPAQAARVFDSLRFRWRGNWVELSVIRSLGQLYLNQGRYREALEALRSAGNRLPDLPEALQLQADLAAAFRTLFLEGQADGLQPVQALALFYDFKELTPIGADGDEMVRRLAQRLVNVDLLDQAASLLKYQAENRLDGVPRAVVATEQALIEVMARKPENALNALNGSRTTLLPTALNSQRRMIEARAWLQLNQLDHAAEILGDDASPDGQAIRAEIAWKRKDWAAAARTYEVGLGRRFETADQPLSPDEEQRLLRAAVAYSLARDEGALTRLRGRYQAFVPAARAPDSLRVALAGVEDSDLSADTFARAVSEDQSFEGWVLKMKQRLREKASTPVRAAPPTLKTASAAAPAGPAAS
jgi:tetratricopeptide (TPR) repeat protein